MTLSDFTLSRYGTITYGIRNRAIYAASTGILQTSKTLPVSYENRTAVVLSEKRKFTTQEKSS